MSGFAVHDQGPWPSRVALAVGPLLVVTLVIWMGGWTGGVRGHAGAEAVALILWGGAWSGAWMLSALGLGFPLRRLLCPGSDNGLALQLALGVGAMLGADAALGRLGVLHLGGSVGAWGFLIAGILIAVWQVTRWLAQRGRVSITAPPILIWTAAPAIAVLLLAATSAPGILWSSEFGGYDALSYHLQLPREWMAAGRIVPLEHNVYSFMPGYVEGAFLHLDLVVGDAIEASIACQMLHAWCALAAAWLVGSLAARYGGAMSGCVASVMFLGTPWIIITGSLAYNEMAVSMMLAAGMLAIDQRRTSAWRRATAVGLLAGAACGAKLTAAGFVALPLIVLLAWKLPVRQWLAAFPSFALTALLVLSPWLIGNAIVSGNPVFPFGTAFFGTGHWSVEQAARWRGGHSFHGNVRDRIHGAWTELMRYGLGPSPDPALDAVSEGGADAAAVRSNGGRHGSWQPQWSLLPWLALVGVAAAVMRTETRRRAAELGLVFLIQLLFWILFTHVKSRFMVPAAVPLSLLVALPLSISTWNGPGHQPENATRPGGRPATKLHVLLLMAVSLVAWSSLVMLIFSRERGGSPAQGVGMTSLFTGNKLSDQQQRSLALVLPTVYINHLLPRESKVLLVGDATPFYYDRPVTYQTTWDRGPMSRAMHAAPNDKTAWTARLRQGGFTHVLVNPTMLEVWSRAGWGDEALTAEKVIGSLDRHARQIRSFDHGERLYALD